jgi:hypothetical protein
MARTYKHKHPDDRACPMELSCARCGQKVRAWCPAITHRWPWHACRAARSPQPFTDGRLIEHWKVER